MNLINKLGWIAAAALGLAVVAVLGRAASAGPLDPPSTPAPTQRAMLFQPANCAGFPIAITNGSYVLASDIVMPAGCAKNGIDIAVGARNVTIDLNGFALRGVAGSLSGIAGLGGAESVTVLNGTVRDWGFSGIQLVGEGHLVDSVHADFNGNNGITVGTTSVVRDSTARDNAADGISAGTKSVITDCATKGNGDVGIVVGATGTVENCVADNNAHGIDAGVGSTVTGVSANNNLGHGIRGSTVNISNCTVHGNGADGINLTGGSGSLVTGCFVRLNGNDGIEASGSDHRIEGNNIAGHGSAGDAGIRVVTAGNTVFRNSLRGNTAPQINAVAGNDIGPTGTAAAATSPWANIAY